MTPEGHLESRDVAAYLDRAVSPAERDRIEGHLAECVECRDEVVQVSRLRHTVHGRRKWLWAAPAAAAAIVALVLVRPTDNPPAGSRLRGGEEPELRLSLVAPPDSAVAAAGAQTFVWRSIGSGVSYRITLTDERGDVLWTTTSADTSMRLPNSIQLRPSAVYFWYVDALLNDGRSITSGARGMRTAP